MACRNGHDAGVNGSVDHIVVASADLDVGVRWVEERLGVAPVFGGVHVGVGTRNALLGLGDQYLEVLALDPGQAKTSSPWSEQIRSLSTPRLWTLAVAKPLQSGKPMSRVRSDGFRLEWEIEFTSTPLFFIDWKECPRPAGLPRGGRITSLSVTTPEPAMLGGVAGVSVHEGWWRVEATVDDTPLS